MNNEYAGRAEQISALVDGELSIDEFADVVASVTDTPDGFVTWQAYHLVGDALRGTAHGVALDGADFVSRLRDRMAAQGLHPQLPRSTEPGVAVEPANAVRHGANDPVMRWKLLAGFASLAAVASFGWHVASLSAGADQMAQQASTQQTSVAATSATESGAQGARVAVTAPVMLRDAHLDALLAAHKQFGGTSALQMPAGFLRNATFDVSNP